METWNLEKNNDCSLFTNSQLLVTDLPDSILLHIFQYLPFSSICQVSKVCHRWNQISSDELLWRSVFLWHYKLPFTTALPKKTKSWRSEFKRLFYHTPALLVEELKEHKDEVLHVSFSHDGTMFATCSKDGYFMLWSMQSNPVRLLFKMDMKSRFSWHFTQFSQFNESDTCLLVSGVYSGRYTTSGEIAIFNLQDNYEMQSRVTNKPYDVFGAWFDNDHLLSGTIYPTGGMSSVSAIWLSKASQEVESEVESVSMVLYRFQNHNSSTVRLINVAEIEKASAADEDGGQSRESGEKLPFNSERDASEPSLLDQLLCKEISEEEFDIENEDCDDEDEGEEDDYDEDDEVEDDHEEESQKIAMAKEVMSAENLEAMGNLEWVKGEHDVHYLNTLHNNIEPRCSGNIKPQPSLCLHDMESFNVNMCKSQDPGAGLDNSSNSSGVQVVNSSNNASSTLPGHFPSSSFNLTSNPPSVRRYEKVSSFEDVALALNATVPVFRGCPSVQYSPQDFTDGNLQVRTAKSVQRSPSQHSSHCLDLLSNESQEVCARNSELCSQDLQNFRRDEDESLPAKMPRECRKLQKKDRHLSSEPSEHSPEHSSAHSESSNSNASPVNLAYEVDDDNNLSNKKYSNINCVDVSRNSRQSLSNSSKQVRPFALPASSSNVEMVPSEGATSKHVSATPLAHCLSQFGSKHDPRQHVENDEASSLSMPSTFCDDLLNAGATSSHASCEKPWAQVNSRPQTFASETPWCSISSAPESGLPPGENNSHSQASTIKAFKQRHRSKRKSKACQKSSSHHDQQQKRLCKHPPEKLLIYTWGNQTFTPHKIGIKRIKWTDFSKGEVTARRSSMLPCVLESLQNGIEPMRRDEPDHSIEMHGHIVGLRVAPDQRYLYVNCRPWPDNYIISDPQESPPLAQEVEISTIDLQTFEFVGPVLRSHKAYTHSDDCFFLSVDVSDDFVVSGAEDKQGYLWDRHYGIPLYRFPHSNVVNCVAVNPRDPEVLVTVSDDFSIKVWTSRHKYDSRRQQSDSVTHVGGKAT